GRREGRANGVSNRREILFLPAPKFHAWHDLAGQCPFGKIACGQTSVITGLYGVLGQETSRFPEMSVFERVRK
ncbi:MAG: hypothetical protein DMF15_12935, partial [Verrucomicrobia bacterium]